MSSQWWTQAYKGGPMVPVPGFPRPLYPPDAAKQGKKPSVNGPDVEAYKRTVSRAGRWPWQPFDRAYSNGFAHGTGGNVINTGVAGVQRQSKITPDSGWIGQSTFNLLRSIRVPDGLPNAGAMAMDAYAQSLLVDAWELFKGKEPEPAPPPGPSKTLRQRALDKAVSQLGTKESPPNSNVTPYTKWYGMTGPWCAMFVTWAYEQVADSPSFAKGSYYAYVPYIVSDARAGRRGLSVTGSPIPGDLVCFDWQRDGTFDHVGLFESWVSGVAFNAIEGNTAVGNDSDGGEVMRRQRNAQSQSTVFVRVAEP